MTAEQFLARLYVDGSLRARFLADPVGEAVRAGLDQATAQRLAEIDREGLELASESFARKRLSRDRAD